MSSFAVDCLIWPWPQHVVQAELERKIFFPQSLKYWDYKQASPYQATDCFGYCSFITLGDHVVAGYQYSIQNLFR